MNIKFEFDYPTSDCSLLVDVDSSETHATLDLQYQIPKLTVDLDLPIQNQIIEIKFVCNDIKITKHPLTITNITLDDYYSLSKILHSGIANFDQQFFEYAQKNKMYIDPSATGNRLDFTGHLAYQFRWPFYKNVFL